MTLRAKKPEVNPTRLKVLLYADKGAGKTHFCCSFPNAYYIDTEKLEDYKDFVEMIKDNNSVLVYLTEMSEIIAEVKELLSVKHDYRTLIIDSLSFPYGWLCQMEAERLISKAPLTEGTEFGANVAKAKRLTFQLGILLTRLDMNVIVTSHERIKYKDSKEDGKIYDISDKMGYALGSVWNLRLLGKNRKLFVEKTRYSELKTNDFVDFNEGFKTLENLFGKEIFNRESSIEELATSEQVKEFNRLCTLLKVPDESIQKWLIKSKATVLSEMSKDDISKYINFLTSQIKGESNAI